MKCRCRWASDPTTGEPERVLNHAHYFPDTGRPTVSVDTCIADHVEMLWQNGIRTVHSCCGHNGRFGPASIGLVYPAQVPLAAKLLSQTGLRWRIFVDVEQSE